MIRWRGKPSDGAQELGRNNNGVTTFTTFTRLSLLIVPGDFFYPFPILHLDSAISVNWEQPVKRVKPVTWGLGSLMEYPTLGVPGQQWRRTWTLSI